MTKIEKTFKVILTAGWIILFATPVLARSFSFKDAGAGLWVFVIIGAVLVLLQLIPAAILFFSFIGTGSAMMFKPKKVPEEKAAEEKEKMVLPGYEPVTVEK